MKFYNLFFIVIVLAVSCVIGCPSKGLKGLVPAAGTVTHDGKPADGANVTFMPVDKSGNARTASAITNANGTFTLKTLAQEGVYPGEYTVMVMKIDDPTNNSQEDVDSGKATKKPIKYLLPQKYASPATTDIKVTIPDKGDKAIAIDLK